MQFHADLFPTNNFILLWDVGILFQYFILHSLDYFYVKNKIGHYLPRVKNQTGFERSGIDYGPDWIMTWEGMLLIWGGLIGLGGK